MRGFKRKQTVQRIEQPITRIALWYLLAALSLLNVLMLLFMPWWVPAAGLCCIGWRAAIASGRLNYPKVWLKSFIAIGGFISLLSYFGIKPVLDFFLCLLLLSVSLRLLELQQQHAAIKQVWISFLVLMTVFIFEQTPLYSAAVYAIALLLLTAVIASFTHDKHLRQRPGLPLTKALLIGALALPVWFALFVGMPRMGPLWHMPLKQEASAKTGMSDTMSPGDIVNLSDSDELVMRVTFTAQVPARSELYWLAMYLDYFDGNKWSESCQHCYQFHQADVRETSNAYQMILEPHQQHWLYTLVPSQLAGVRFWRAGDVYRTARPLTQRRQFTAYVQEQRAEQTVDRQRYLQLPAGGNPQTRQWVAELRRQSANDTEVLQRILQLYQTSFSYTLKPPALQGERVDQFLFSTRAGYCEHFASSLVFALRAAGIPARVAVGYMGGEIHADEKLVVVRQHDAHAWVEVWLDYQWQRIDPTAYVAPERINQSFSGYSRANAPEAVRAVSNWFASLRQQKDVMDYWWARWVLGYSNADQANTIERLFAHDWKALLLRIALAVTLICVLALCWYWRKAGITMRLLVLALYQDTVKRYRAAGLACDIALSPAANAERVAAYPRQAMFARRANQLQHTLYAGDGVVGCKELMSWLLINIQARCL